MSECVRIQKGHFPTPEKTHLGIQVKFTIEVCFVLLFICYIGKGMSERRLNQ